MSHNFLIKRGDREPAISRRLMQSGAAIDLTGCSVKFLMRGSDGLKVDAAATIGDDPTTGDVTYEWAAADVDTAGVYRAEWEITRSGRTLTVPTSGYIQVTVIEDIDGGATIESDPPPLDGGDVLVGGAGSSGVIEIAADDTVELAISSLNTETQSALDNKADNTFAAINALLGAANATVSLNGQSLTAVNVLATDGIQSAPGIAFAGATGTGFWRNTGNGNLVAVVAGVIACFFSDSGETGFFGPATFFGHVRLTEAPPANAGSSGSSGQIAVDDSYIYVCTATNTWKRAALATWP